MGFRTQGNAHVVEVEQQEDAVGDQEDHQEGL